MTGGAGFIGSHLCELLLDEGSEVWALDDLSTGSTRQRRAPERPDRDFHLVVDSVLSRAVVNELVHKCDVVYHLAAAVGVRLIVEQPVHTLVTNLAGHGGRPRALQPLRQAGSHRVDVRGVRGPPRRETPGGDRAAGLRPDDAAPLGVRGLEGDGRVPGPGLPSGGRPRLRHRAALQHRRPATDRPVRDGRASLRGARARGRAARGVRRRQADEVLLPRRGHDPRPARADGDTTRPARSTTWARRSRSRSSTSPRR